MFVKSKVKDCQFFLHQLLTSQGLREKGWHEDCIWLNLDKRYFFP